MNLGKIDSKEVYAGEDEVFELNYDLGYQFEEILEEVEMEEISKTDETEEATKETVTESAKDGTEEVTEGIVEDDTEEVTESIVEDVTEEVTDNTEKEEVDVVESDTEEKVTEKEQEKEEDDTADVLDSVEDIQTLDKVLSYTSLDDSEEVTEDLVDDKEQEEISDEEVEEVTDDTKEDIEVESSTEESSNEESSNEKQSEVDESIEENTEVESSDEESSNEETSDVEDVTENSNGEVVEESSSEEQKETTGEEIEETSEVESTEVVDEVKETESEKDEVATPSNANTYVKWEDEEIGQGEKPIIKNIKANMEAYGFDIIDISTNSLGDTSVEVNYTLSDEITTGIYFGKIITTYSYKNKTYHTSQGFVLTINGEEVVNPNEELTLITEFNGAEVSVTGPRSSFPEGEELELSVSEVDTEKVDMVTEALDKKSEELDLAVGGMKALDIKVLADGEYKELRGDVKVEFKDLTLTAMYQSVDLDEEEELSGIETVDLLESDESSEFEEEANTEEAVTIVETTEILHLDEDLVELNNMETVMTEDGTLEMETSHFSIFIVVNFEAKEVPLHIQHYADIVRPNVMEAKQEEKDLGIYWKLDNGLTSSDGLWAGFGAESVTDDGDSIYRTEYTKIYSDDYFKLPGWTTKGIPFSTVLRKLCKLLVEYNGDDVQNHYRADKVTFKNGTRELECIINEDGSYICNWIKGEPEIIDGVDGYTSGDVMIPLDKTNNEIVIHYVNTMGEVYVDTNFHDYSATVQNVDTADKAEDTITYTNGRTEKVVLGRRLNTKYVGINNSDKLTVEYEDGEVKELYPPKDVSKRLLVGGESLSLYNYENAKYASSTRPGNINSRLITPNIVQDRLDAEGNLIYKEGLFAPLLFVKGNIYTEETYRLRKTDAPEKVKYLANQYLPGYKLGFKRYGDFHVITNCVNPSGVTVLSNLHKMKHVGSNWNGTRELYTNLFWPLDEIGVEKGDNGAAKINDRLMPHIGFTANDDSRIWWKAIYENGIKWPIYRVSKYNKASEWAKYDAISKRNEFHNWFFGMDFEVEFDITNYIGPLDFYFKGDDDLFVFIDGIKVCDLGGVHSSIGSYLDLKDTMKDKGLVREDEVTKQLIPIDEDGNDMPDHKFKLKVFYTERGGTGSTCYMTYTLPKVTEPEFEKYDSHKLYLHKHWLDESDENSNRPSTITVQLYQDGEPFGEQMELSYDDMELESDNEWVYTWNHLPEGHVYTVKEVNVDTNYVGDVGIPTTVEGEEAATELDMVNIEATQISTKKTFSNTLEKKDVYVALYQVDEIDTEPILVNGSVRLLNKDNNWEMTWDKLPKYAYNKEGHDKFEAFEITYLPYEVEATGVSYTDVIDNELTDVDDYAVLKAYSEGDITVDGKYLVTYNENHTEINNERVTDMTKFTVTKDWVDTDSSKRPYWVLVNLYQDGKPYKQVYLSESNNYTHTWDVPLNKADDTFYEYTVSESFENKDLAEGDIVKFNTKDAYQVSYDKVSDTEVKITNTYIPPETKILRIQKLWENTDSVTKSESITVNVYQNSELYKQESLTKDNEYTVELEVPILDVDKNEYTYTVYESVNNVDITEGNIVYLNDTDKYRVTYVVAGDNYTITNTYLEPSMKLINVEKIWKDEGKDTRPHWIEVHLYQDDAFYKTVYLNEDNGYKYTWQVPAEKKDGTSYKYSVYEVFNGEILAEDDVVSFNGKDKYIVAYTGTGTDVVITNTWDKPKEEKPSETETSSEEQTKPSETETSTEEQTKPSETETSTEEQTKPSETEPSSEEPTTEAPSKPYRGGGKSDDGGGEPEKPKETQPIEEIPDEKVPLGSFKPEEIMTDEIKYNMITLLDADVPLYGGLVAELPKTGDTSHTGFWAILFGISAFGLGLFGFNEYRRRKNKKK